MNDDGLSDAPAPRRWLRPRDALLSLALWGTVLVLFAVFRALDPARPDVPVDPFFRRVLLAGALWAVATPVVLALAEHVALGPHRWLRRAAFHLGVGLLLATAIDQATQRISLMPQPPPVRQAPPGCEGRPGPRPPQGCPPPPPAGLPPARPEPLPPPARLLGHLFLYLSLLAAGHARTYLARSREREAEAVRLSALLATARLDALRMQLNPHFLFNTLNAVAALAERDPAGVRRVVARLSALLRRVLDDTGAREVPLADEVAFLDDYLDIQRVRLGDRLTTTLHVSPDAARALVPALLLQPLVENAVEHGVARLEDRPGHVGITAERVGGHLVVQIEDDGPGLSGGGAGERVGLTNTRARLAARYGDAGRLRLEAGRAGGCVATVELPFYTTPEAP